MEPACAGSLESGFDDGPTQGQISAPGEVDCLDLQGAAAGDQIRIDFVVTSAGGNAAKWTIEDANGQDICDFAGASSSHECELTGSPGWVVSIEDMDDETWAYSIAARNLDDPQGCGSLGAPAVWSFAGPRIDGSINGTLEADCYAFTREPEDGDATYWFRAVRSADPLYLRWRVYDPAGEKVCDFDEFWNFSNCELSGSGQFIFVVADSRGDRTGPYSAIARRTTDPEGCMEGSVDFGPPALAGTIQGGADADCVTLPDDELQSGDMLRIDLHTEGEAPTPSMAILDGSGEVICAPVFFFQLGECELSGEPGWTFLIDDTWGEDFSYHVAIRRVTNPAGCTAIEGPDALAFDRPPIAGSIDSTLDARCYTFERGSLEPDARYWFNPAPADASPISPSWQVFGPDGQELCQGAERDWDPCDLSGPGQFTLVIRAGTSAGTDTGGFGSAAVRLSSPAGCSAMPPTFTLTSVEGALSEPGEMDCYRFDAAAGDEMTFEGSPWSLTVVDDDGQLVCIGGIEVAECVFEESGEFSLIVSADFWGPPTGPYSFEATCLSGSCMTGASGIGAVTPERVGASASTTLLLRGRGLADLEALELRRGGTSIAGELQEPSPDGRSVEVRFDLLNAALGDWTVHGTYEGGPEQEVGQPVTIEEPNTQRLQLTTTGRGVYRAGTPFRYTTSISNPGNSDVLAVPLVLRGIPEGSVIMPVSEVMGLSGAGPDPVVGAMPYDQSAETVLEDDGIAAPFIIPRVPAGGSVSFAFRITPPAGADGLQIHALLGTCFSEETSIPPGSAGAAGGVFRVSTGISTGATTCAGFMGGLIINAIVESWPGSACIQLASNVVLETAVALDTNQEILSGQNMFGWILGAADCGLTFFPPYTAAKTIVKVVSLSSDLIGAVKGGANCGIVVANSVLSADEITSLDPNDIVGPSGSGAERYIRGDTPSPYEILFENVAEATAPAARVEITDQLDTDVFDPRTVLFRGVEFGDTRYVLPHGERSIDHVIDLRPENDLLVHVQAKTSLDGEVSWVLQALDPLTMEPPEDPTAGFLPPNVNPPEGEGLVSYDVELRDLFPGDEIENQASIVFDVNEPIETGVWRNVIDRDPPEPEIFIEQDDAISVSWDGTDDAAGIDFWEIQVSKDGGPFELWWRSSEAGSKPFAPTEPGEYAFFALAHDGAGNLGESNTDEIEFSGLDDVPPLATIVSGPADGSTIRQATASFEFVSDEPDSTFECKVDSGAFGTCGSPRSVGPVADGQHTFSVRAIDGASNTGPAASRSFSVDTSVGGGGECDAAKAKLKKAKAKVKKAKAKVKKAKAKLKKASSPKATAKVKKAKKALKKAKKAVEAAC